MPPDETNRPVRLLRLAEVKAKTGYATSTLYDLISKGRFPRQVTLASGTSVAWIESEVDQHIAGLIAKRDQAVAS